MNVLSTLRFTVSLLLLAVCLAAVQGCSQETAQAALASPPPPAVTVALPMKKSVTHYAEFTGTTEAFESVTIRARVEGVLEKLHFDSGAMVQKGDLLFSIDSSPFVTRLEEAKAELAIREAELKVAESTSLRRERAFRDKAVSEVAVIQAKADLETARAAISAAKAAVRSARLDLSYTRIKAPISGRIGRSLIDTGNLVGAGERTVLTSIVRDDPIYAYFSVNEKDLLHYQQQMAAQPSPASGDTPAFLGLTAGDGYPFAGRIDYVDNRVDPETGTIRVRAVFSNNDERLLPGLYVRLRVPIGSAREELVVPETALSRDQQGHYLLVAGSEDKVVYQPVSTGPLVEGMRVINKGVSLEDRVIVKGLQKAQPGAMVTPMAQESLDENNSEVAAPSA